MSLTINMYGDLRYRLGYIGEEDEQCLYLYRKGLLGRCAAIPLSAAWKYYPELDQEGNVRLDGISHQQQAIVAASHICKALDMDTSRKTVMQMIMRIQDRLPELLALPPREDEVEKAVRALVSVDGQEFETTGADVQRDNLGIKVAH